MNVKVTKVTEWSRVLNAARMTVNKCPKEGEPSDKFKKSILLSEHSPIRLLEFDVVLNDVPYFVIMHLVRHNQGVEKFVQTSREDRTGVPRNERAQTDLINCQFSLNAQALINISQKRMCIKADPETRRVWNSVVAAVANIEPLVAAACVPSCIYRGRCPEPDSCGFAITDKHHEWLDKYWDEL